MEKINNNFGKILIFAGAGISAESGLSTFRDKDGLWTKYDINKVCTYRTLLAAKDDLDKRKYIFDFYNDIRKSIHTAIPNKAHIEIASWQKKYGTDRVKIVTANIDDLFEKAGCEEVVHVHGDIQNMLCIGCGNIWKVSEAGYKHDERCPRCNSRQTKPNVVFFGEQAPHYLTMQQIFNIKRRAENDLLLYVGSSQNVIPPSRLIGKASKSYHLGKTILVDLNQGEEGHLFQYKYLCKATEGIPRVSADFLQNNS